MAEVCLVCLSRTSNLLGIFVKEESEDKLPSPAEMINECTGCKIQQNQFLNCQICESCVLAAKCAFKLKQGLLKNDLSFADMEEVCCVCRSKSITLVDAFAKRQHPEGEPCLSEMLNKCLGTEPASNEQVPWQICLSCILTVRNSFQFKRKCENKLLTASNTQCSAQFILPDANRIVKTEMENDDSDENTENYVKSKINKSKAVESPVNANIKNEVMEEQEDSDEFNQFDYIIKEETSFIEYQPESSNVAPETPLKKNIFKCDTCFKTFNRQMWLTIHERIHTGERPYKCSECSKDFISEVALSRHMMSHSHVRPFHCPHCPKAFKFKDLLKKHINLHVGKKSFQCPYCTFSFVRKAHLTSHIRIHSGGNPQECPHCPMTFSRKEPLVDHIRIHTGERPFKCPHCPLTFSLKQSLGFHIPEHTGDYPKKCPYCALSYGSEKTLKRHMLIHAKDSKESKNDT